MRYVIVDNYKINKPILDILQDIKCKITNGKLSQYEEKHDNINVTCPFHKDGKENRPSSNIYIGDDEDVPYGFFRCFTCGEQGSFAKFVGECFDSTEAVGKQWLIDNYGEPISESTVDTTPIRQDTTLDIKKALGKFKDTKYKDESVLDKLQDWHPYLAKRKLSRAICAKFKVKYDPKTQCVVFPTWDAKGHYLFNTRRSVLTKFFSIPEDVEKPIYLLNFILNEGIDTVVVCESQINCLYMWTLGIPAVALFGTGSDEQYEILKKTSVSHYILGLDGDTAGNLGCKRFKANMPENVIIEKLELPFGKDLNDLSRDEIMNLFEKLHNQGV